MKNKTISLAPLAAIAIAGSASAATISWQGPQAISASTDVSTQGTLVQARSQGPTVTVNGVTFSSAAGNYSSTGFNNGHNDYLPMTFIGSNDTEGQNYATLLDAAHYMSPNGTASFTFSGLTVGQNYLLQFWVADYRNSSEDRQLTLTAGNSSGVLHHLNNTGVQGSFVIGTFTADALSQTVTVTDTHEPQINAVQLRAIPEPSATLLGGLGLLALLRRRR
jgi:hypothetical protein